MSRVAKCRRCGQDGIHHAADGRPLIHTRTETEMMNTPYGPVVRRQRAVVCEAWTKGARP